MTKAQRSARAKRSGRKRAKQKLAIKMLQKVNPALVRRMKKGTASDVVKVTRLKSGGYSVVPMKSNAGPFSRRKTKKRVKLFRRSEEKYMQQFRRLGRHRRGKKAVR